MIDGTEMGEESKGHDEGKGRDEERLGAEEELDGEEMVFDEAFCPVCQTDNVERDLETDSIRCVFCEKGWETAEDYRRSVENLNKPRVSFSKMGRVLKKNALNIVSDAQIIMQTPEAQRLKELLKRLFEKE